jgi:hypothetical protein
LSQHLAGKVTGSPFCPAYGFGISKFRNYKMNTGNAGYLSNYEHGWTGLGAIREMTPAEFKAWSKTPASTKPSSGHLSALDDGQPNTGTAQTGSSGTGTSNQGLGAGRLPDALDQVSGQAQPSQGSDSEVVAALKLKHPTELAGIEVADNSPARPMYT